MSMLENVYERIIDTVDMYSERMSDHTQNHFREVLTPSTRILNILIVTGLHIAIASYTAGYATRTTTHLDPHHLSCHSINMCAYVRTRWKHRRNVIQSELIGDARNTIVRLIINK